jgi:hypothetical protein
LATPPKRLEVHLWRFALAFAYVVNGRPGRKVSCGKKLSQDH